MTYVYKEYEGKIKMVQEQNTYRDLALKQDNTEEYFGCYLHSDLNGVTMTLRVLKKIDTKLNF